MKKKQNTPSFQKKYNMPLENTDSKKENAPNPKSLAALFEQCGITLTQQQIDQFWAYHGLLRRHNSVLNLTRIHQFNNMVLKLYVDSVLPNQFCELPSPLMDLGSGPGMPGIPLKIVRPDLHLWLAEGRAKRTDFLKTVIDELGLKNIEIIPRNITPDFEQTMQGIITRAVETIPATMNRVQGCLAHKGHLIFMKGPRCTPEIETAVSSFSKQYVLEQDHSYRIGQTMHQRRLVCFQRLDTPPRVIVAQAVRRHQVLQITSEQNPRFKSLKRLLSTRGLKKADQALMSGNKQVSETVKLYPQQCQAWITNGHQSPPPSDAPAQMHWLQLSESLFNELDLFGTKGPLLNIAVSPVIPWTPEEAFPTGCSILLPFQDPENIGTTIRSAVAFGAAQVILLAESAHPYHPKALRAASGTTIRIQLRRGPALSALPQHLPIVPLSAEGHSIHTAKFPKAFGLLAGIEGQGLPAQWRNQAVCIPIDPRVESLNAATATAIALYEWKKKSDLSR